MVSTSLKFWTGNVHLSLSSKAEKNSLHLRLSPVIKSSLIIYVSIIVSVRNLPRIPAKEGSANKAGQKARETILSKGWQERHQRAIGEESNLQLLRGRLATDLSTKRCYHLHHRGFQHRTSLPDAIALCLKLTNVFLCVCPDLERARSDFKELKPNTNRNLL